MIFVEEATEKELESVQALDLMVAGNDSRKDFLTAAVLNGRCLVVRIGDTVAGFGILQQSFYRQGFISLLIVHPDYCRQGIATALIRRMEAICPTEKLFTSANESNVTAQQTYEALGFVRSGFIENLDEGDPEIIYFKRPGGTNRGG